MLRYLKIAGVVICIAAVIAVGYFIGRNTKKTEMAFLVTQLAQNEKTAEIDKNLYATKVIEAANLDVLLNIKSAEVILLKKQIDDSKADLLTTQQISLKWKKSYESALAANQETIPPTATTPERKKITFSGVLGPIEATGYTITDPAEAFISLKQKNPLILTVAVARNIDGTWSTYVTSSDDNIQADVKLAGVDTGAIAPKWRQRIWLTSGVNVIGDKSAYVGMSYQWDRFTAGIHCSTGANCGFDLGFRVFK